MCISERFKYVVCTVLQFLFYFGIRSYILRTYLYVHRDYEIVTNSRIMRDMELGVREEEVVSPIPFKSSSYKYSYVNLRASI